jgi:hypothetical protein
MLTQLIRLAAILHFGILLASALTPNVLDWRDELKKLSPLSRQLIWVHGAFIVLIIIGFGAISLLCAPELAAGSHLARILCGFISLFWLARLIIQFFTFDARPFLTKLYLKIGYHGLTVVFATFVAIYGYAALWA